MSLPAAALPFYGPSLVLRCPALTLLSRALQGCRWMLILDGVPGEGAWRLVIAAELPHYTSTDAITGTVIFVALLVIVAVAALRRR